MKKFAVLICVITCVIGIAGCAWGGVSLSAFPDPGFREYLKGRDRGWTEYDSEGYAYTVGEDDGILDDREIEEITEMNLSYGGSTITSLKGIEYFTALKNLHCSSCQLTELDVSKNTALTGLECSGKWHSGGVAGGNCLTILNVSGCTALTSLNCQGNQLTELDVSSCISLKYLDCSYNKLTRLDVSKNMALNSLWCDMNNLTNLDVSNHPALIQLGCGGKFSDNGLFTMDSLITLDVSNCTALTLVNSSHKGIWQIHIPSLKKLNASNCTSLTELNCATEHYVYPYDHGQLATLDLSGCTALTHLWCYGNQLTQLDLSGCTALTWLHCYGNKLETLNVGQFKDLQSLICSDNQLTELDVSRNRMLTGLNFSSNKITEIDVSNNTALTGLICSGNQLKELNVSNNTSLTKLLCDGNKLTELNLTHNTALTQLECNDNQLTELDLSHTAVEYQWPYTDYRAYLSQKRRGLKVKKTSEGYEVNMKDYVSHLENIDSSSISDTRNGSGYMNFISYNKETGIAIFKEPIMSLSYEYNTCRNDILMPVTIINLLSIVALERYGSETDGLIIHDITENGYLDGNGNQLTENVIHWRSDSDYGKLGLAADGNSRLIIRVQTDKPGTVSFSFNEDIGAKLESLSRKELTASDQLNTTQIYSNTYQASAVLVAPERFPNGKNFPYDKFKVHVRFTDEDSEITESDLELKLEAAPVILIHGLRDEGANCFGVGKNSGIWHTLRQNGFRDIRIWNYDGSRGPEDLLSGVGFANPLFRTLGEVFDKYLNRGIVCTRADFVCHSMGGLMARKFLEETGKELINGNNWSERSYKQGMVRRVITIATPHRGSPWADIMIEGSSNPMFWPIRQILYILMNISAGKLGYFDKNSDSAFRDLMTTAPRSYGFPSDVPMYSIYGDVKDVVKAFSQYIGNAGTWIGNLAKLTGPHVAVIMQVVGSSMEFSAWLADDVINGNVFKGEGHDMIVSVPSAAGDFAGSESGYKGLDYMHTSICRQDNIGIEVVNLLRGPVDVFKKFGASGKTAVNKSLSTPKNIASNLTVSNSVIEKASSSGSNNTGSEQMKFIEALNLKIEPSVFTITDNSSQTVNFNVTVSNPTTYDIYCAVEDGNSYRLFKFPDSNDGKTFSAQLVFASQDFGVMNAFCFSRNPNDSEGKSLNVSNVAKILALSAITNANIVSLDFAGKETAYTSVNSETPAGLFAVDADGRYYDVSSPLAGTQWTLTEIARVNENGCIHGLKEGSTTLTATFRGLTASVNVEVSAALIEEADTPPEILTETLSNGITKQPYSLQLKASRTAPITWTYAGKLPAGLTLSDSGLISGTPKKAGKSTFTVTAQNDYGKSSQKYTLQVFDPVSITTASLKAGTIGKSYSVTMRAKGTKPITWTAEGLPNGLIMNEKGRISGKSTVYGMFNVKVRVENGAGSVTKNLTLEIKAIAPKLSGSLKKATLNETYSSGLKVTGSTPITWSIEGNLPDGLTLDSSSGIISGIPTSYAKSGYKITLTATNDGGSKSKKITLKVNGKALKITAKLPQAIAGENYSAELSAMGSEPITFAADLPEYLTLEGNTISGTVPDSVKSFKITVYASNPVKQDVKKNYTVKVSAKKSNLNADNDIGITENSMGINSGITDIVPVFSENRVYPHSENVMIVAELGEISCDEAGMYDFEIQLPDYAPKGSELVYIANSDRPSEDDDIAEFYDEAGVEVSAVPENRRIIISIWLNTETTYNPVIAIKH